MNSVQNNTLHQEVRLASGAHEPTDGKGCVMEVVSCLYREKWSDAPPCTCPALAAFARRFNDWLTDEERYVLWPFVNRLGNTNDGRTQERAFRFADWAVREIAAIHNPELATLATITDQRSARAAARAAGESRSARAAAWAAARAAARAAGEAGAAARAAGEAGAAWAGGAAERANIIQRCVALLDELCPPPNLDVAWGSLEDLR